MADELLRTKLMPPPGHDNLIDRDRLRKRVENGLKLPLTLVVAPAGAGKTSLLRSWRASPDGQRTRLAWVALDEHDNDPVRFWRYVVAALEAELPGAGKTARSLLDMTQDISVRGALISILNSLAEINQDCVLVLDDYHLIETAEIHELLTFFIENLPISLHVLITARADPALPLGRWRARGQMIEIRDVDLRFTKDETSELIQSELPETLTTNQVALLHARTEGWAAGLHLAALALRGRDNADAFLQSFTGSHHFVLTYLTDDVIERQTVDVQDFLLKTSILSQLNGPLCDSLTGRSNGTAMLHSLATANLFTMPIDDGGTWYRYHQLFAGVLQNKLQQRNPAMVPDLHRRAAEWYENHGFIVHAIDHALAAHDSEHAANLIQSTSRATLSRGEARLVRRWIEAVPVKALEHNTRLLLAGGWSQVITGPLGEVEGWLTRAERAFPDDTSMSMRDFKGEVAALRTIVFSFLGDVEGTISQAEQARKHLVEEDLMLRGIVAMSLGHAYRSDGMSIESATAYREAIDLGLAVDGLYVVIDSMTDLAIVLMQQGKLREAAATLHKAEQVLTARNATDLPIAGSVATTWPELLFEMNEPEAALAFARKGLELGRQGAKADLLVSAHRGIGTAYWAMRMWDEALQENQRSADVALEYGLKNSQRALEARIAHIHLTRGDLSEAQAWASRYQSRPGLPGYVREAEELMLARISIASGDARSALAILAALHTAAQASGRARSVMEILNLEAMALYALRDQPAAMSKLSRSLRIAAPEGYIRLFLDESSTMTTLLQIALEQKIEETFTRKLVRLLDESNASVPLDLLPEPGVEALSDRELAVLRLMVAGLSAPEMAAELFVATSTVRSHLKSIYRKLDVHSRDQAVTRARELHLS